MQVVASRSFVEDNYFSKLGIWKGSLALNQHLKSFTPLPLTKGRWSPNYEPSTKQPTGTEVARNKISSSLYAWSHPIKYEDKKKLTKQ